jgi:hypothetical protein
LAEPPRAELDGCSDRHVGILPLHGIAIAKFWQVVDFATRPVDPAVLVAGQIELNLLDRLALFHWISGQKSLD